VGLAGLAVGRCSTALHDKLDDQLLPVAAVQALSNVGRVVAFPMMARREADREVSVGCIIAVAAGQQLERCGDEAAKGHC
jgi:hypothetical protein